MNYILLVVIGRLYLYREIRVKNKYCDHNKSAVSYGQAYFSRS